MGICFLHIGRCFARDYDSNAICSGSKLSESFQPDTEILYTLANSSKVRLTVFDVLGREVAVLVNGVQNAGQHTVQFSGAGFTSGVYFYRLDTNNDIITKKMLLLK